MNDEITSLSYHINITPKHTVFSGHVEFRFTTLKQINVMSLNAKNLSITTCILHNAHTSSVCKFSLLNDVLSITCSLTPNETYVLEISYSGIVNTNNEGVYSTKYIHKGKLVDGIATQFEPIYARQCFPCIDNPNQKATFNLTLNVQHYAKDCTVLSNTNVKTIQDRQYVFETTPLMSTYLLAFFIGHTESITKTVDGIRVSIHTPISYSQYGELALRITCISLLYYAKLFGTNYMLNKMDLVAVPDFSSGAMENPGLVTFRPKLLLYSDSLPFEAKLNIMLTIFHEIAHQWFGNLVTMKNWNDLWLNESFATYMSYYAINQIFPDYHVFDYFFTHDQCLALESDILQNTHSVESKQNNVQISESFDHITYAKGASLLKMFHHHNQDFISSLRTYFDKYAYSNTDTNDMLSALGMINYKSWIVRPNYPIIKVTKNDFITILKPNYDVPLCMSYNNKEWNYTLNSTLNVLQPHIIVNHNNTGFFITDYDETLMTNTHDHKISAINLAGMIHDAYLLSFYKNKDALCVLEFISKVRITKSYPLLYTIISVYTSCITACHDNVQIVKLFKSLLTKLIEPFLAEAKSNDLFDTLIMNTAVFCDMKCTPTKIHPKAYYTTLAKQVKTEELLKLYETHSYMYDADYILQALGTKSDSIAAVFETKVIRQHDIQTAVKAIVNNDKVSILQYVFDHFDIVSSRLVPNSSLFGTVMTTILKCINTQESYTKYKQLIETHSDKFGKSQRGLASTWEFVACQIAFRHKITTLIQSK